MFKNFQLGFICPIFIQLIIQTENYKPDVQPIYNFCIFGKDGLSKHVRAKNCRIAKRD